VMGRATELIALSNMTSDERKRFAYGNNAATYFTHITIDTELLKKVKPPKSGANENSARL
jgi:hypothetical protein